MMNVYGRLRNRCRRILQLYRCKAELAALPRTELERIAQEVGASASDLTALECNHTGPETLMPERLRQLGLDATYVARTNMALYRDLERTCARCLSSGRCARDLAKGDVQAGMDDYCPNASTMDAVLIGRDAPPPR
jgi:hypothetical protein